MTRDLRGFPVNVKKGLTMKLRYSFAGAVALVALMSAAQAADMQPVLKAPAPVDQQVTGYVEVYSGFATTKATECFFGEGCDSFKAHGWALGGAARANYWIAHDMSVQVDAQADGTSYESSGRFSTHSYLVGGHWSWRNPQQSLYGVFAAVGDAGGSGFTDSQRHALIGAEAQWYWNQFTLYAQGGYDTTLGTVESFGIDSVNAWFIRGTGRYFINPNFLIEGTVMYANGNIDFNESGFSSLGFNTWTWGVKGEWRFATAPFSVYAKYEGSQTKYDSSDFFSFTSAKTTDQRVLFGLKLHMGDRTLQQTDRAGATLDIKSPLANPTSPIMFTD
jgi:opacity protein-like surface antigen